MVEIKNDCDEVVMRSKNLRGIMVYARGFHEDSTVLRQRGKTLHVTYPDGSTCVTKFADAQVLSEWIAGRVKYGRGKFAAAD